MEATDRKAGAQAISAYIVFTREKTSDQAELDVCAKEAQASVDGHELKALALYRAHEDVEGAPTEGTVIFQFPSRAAANAWYDSPLDRKAREHRFKGANYRVTLVEGV
jgi:uncharacterized protein (DUF1330 family)